MKKKTSPKAQPPQPAQHEREQNAIEVAKKILGRERQVQVVPLTSDGYIGVSVPYDAKDFSLEINGIITNLHFTVEGKPYTYEIGNVAQPVPPASLIIGSFTEKEYDKRTLAKLMNIEEATVTDATHRTVLDVLNDKMQITFVNTTPKPHKDTPANSHLWVDWAEDELLRWERCLIIHKSDRAMAYTDINTMPMDTVDTKGMQVGIKLFDGAQGINWAKDMLTMKQMSADEFRQHCIVQVRTAYRNGWNDYQTDKLGAMKEFLQRLQQTNETTLALFGDADNDATAMLRSQIEQCKNILRDLK